MLEKAQIALGDNPSLKGNYEGNSQRELLEVGSQLYARQVAFESLMQGAMNQASLGRVNDTAEKLRAAHAYLFSVGLDPDAEAKTMVVNALTEQAGESIARDDLDRARQLYTQLHRIDPTIDGNREFNRVLAGVKRGQAKNLYLGAIGQPEKAIKLLEQAQDLDPEPSEKFAAAKAAVMAIAHKEKGDQLAEGGKIESAIEEYEAARTLDPSMDLVPVEEAKIRRMDFLRSNASRLVSAGDRAGALVSLLSLRELDSTVSLDHELIVLTLPSGEGRRDLRRYLEQQKEKVFLLTPLHSWQWVAGMKTPEAAMAKAKEDALVRYGGAEAYVYMQNDTVVVPNEDLTILRQLLERSSNSADARSTGASDLPDSTEPTERLRPPIMGKMEPEVD
ncbi:Tetratricopeptide repeat protein [compost metagenome]